MAKTVFILGAGASKHAGAPLMNEFLDKAWSLLATGKLGAAENNDFQLVRNGINELQLAHSKGDLDIWNLEAVFDAFEMAALIGRLGNLGEEDVKRLPEAMRQVILATLEEEMLLPVEREDGSPLPAPTAPYRGFVAALTGRPQDREEYPAVVTFNYDICLEWALYPRGCSWMYCLNEAEPNNGPKVLKLHGSLNWAFCRSCGAVGISWELGDIVRAAARNADLAHGLRLSQMQPRVVTRPPQLPQCKCGEPNRAVMLVPPTINKGPYHAVLSRVWAAAAAELRSAEEIFVCGYSLPETDLFFRYLYAVGTIGEASLRRVWVFNPDASVKPRFEKLLGRQVRGQEDGFLLFPLTFDNIPWDAVLAHDLNNLPAPT